MKTFFTLLRALLYGGCFVLLWGWLALGVRTYDSKFAFSLPAWTEIIGIAFMTAGGVLAVLCVSVFVTRGRGTPAPFDAPREFVATGPYRYVRNPMYIGGWFVLAGFGMYGLSISILLFSFVWLLLFHLFVILYEEPNLEQRFGRSYLDYKKGVNRWVPHLTKT